MDTIVKHFIFTTPDWESESGDRRGRFAIAMIGDGVAVVRLSGPAPRVGHVMAAVRLWPELRSFCNSAAAYRRNPYIIVRRIGMSGCHDYILREVRSTALADYPIRAALHVSDYGACNRGIGSEARPMWAGDFVALLSHAVPGERAGDGECAVEEVEPLRFEDITPARRVMFGVEDGDFTADEPAEPDEVLSVFADEDPLPSAAILARLAAGLVDDEE